MTPDDRSYDTGRTLEGHIAKKGEVILFHPSGYSEKYPDAEEITLSSYGYVVFYEDSSHTLIIYSTLPCRICCSRGDLPSETP